MKPRWIRYLVRGGFFFLTAYVLSLFRYAYFSTPTYGESLGYGTVYGVLSALIFYLGVFLIPRALLKCGPDYLFDTLAEYDYKKQCEFLSSLNEEEKRKLGAQITMYADKLGASDRTIAAYSRKLRSHSVYKYMTGEWTDFDLSELYAIANALNVSPEDLLHIDRTPVTQNVAPDATSVESHDDVPAAEIISGMAANNTKVISVPDTATKPNKNVSVTLKRYTEPTPAKLKKKTSIRKQRSKKQTGSRSAIIRSVLISVAVIGFVACLCIIFFPKINDEAPSSSLPPEQFTTQSASAFFALSSELSYNNYYNSCYVEFIGDPTYEIQTLALSPDDADVAAADRSVSCSVTSAIARTRLDIKEGTYLIRFTLRHQNDFTSQEPLIYRSEEAVLISPGDYSFDLKTHGSSEHFSVRYGYEDSDMQTIKLLRIYKLKA